MSNTVKRDGWRDGSAVVAENVIARIDADAPAPKPRGPYKKRGA